MNKQFEEWLINDYERHFNYFEGTRGKYLAGKEDRNSFYNLPFSMQWGIYLEFFDSVGIYIQIHAHRKEQWFYSMWKPELFIPQNQTYWESRTEAQQEAIKKAFEILES